MLPKHFIKVSNYFRVLQIKMSNFNLMNCPVIFLLKSALILNNISSVTLLIEMSQLMFLISLFSTFFNTSTVVFLMKSYCGCISIRGRSTACCWDTENFCWPKKILKIPHNRKYLTVFKALIRKFSLKLFDVSKLKTLHLFKNMK